MYHLYIDIWIYLWLITSFNPFLNSRGSKITGHIKNKQQHFVRYYLNLLIYCFLPSSWVYPRTRRTSNHLIPARGGRDLRKCGRIIRKAWAGRGGWRILFIDQLYKALTKDHPQKTWKNHPEIINIKLLNDTEIWRTQLNKGHELQQPQK